MRTAFVTSIAMLLSISLLAQGGAGREWSLVYANDENGKKTEGDLTKLISLVRKGQPIRIGWTIESSTNKSLKVEHIADAAFITVMSDSIVFAQITPIIGQSPSIKDKFVALGENLEWSFIGSTTGNHDAMFTNKKTGEISNHKPFRCSIRWFANAR